MLMLLAVLVFSPAMFALDWAKTEIEQRALIGEPLAPFVFTFTNSGSSAVMITAARASCGCLTLELDKKIFAPAESGKITVLFDRTGLVGEVERTVFVTTDEVRREPYPLVVRADLPEALTLAPRLLNWKIGAARATLSVDINIHLPDGVHLTRATSNRDDFEAVIFTLEEGRRYRLDITPSETTTARLAIITLQASEVLPVGTALTVYAQVR